jgi:hypothetical protein
VREWGLEQKLSYDWYPRYSLLDHFLAPGTTLEDFAAARFADQGDFVLGTYAVEARVQGRDATATLSRDGSVAQGQDRLPVRVEKQISLEGSAAELRVYYRIVNQADQPLATRFGSEQNFALHAGHGYGCFYRVPGHQLEDDYLDSQGVIASASAISMTLEYREMRVEMRWDKPATLWRTPVETVVYALEGYERAYQSSCVLPLWDLDLAPGASWEVEITFTLAAL